MKKLIFDVDGTILDSMHIWFEPLEELLNKYGHSLKTMPIEDKGKIEALPFEKMCHYLAEEIINDMTGEEIIDHFSQIVGHAYDHELMPVEGVLEILKKLKDQGFSMSIASSTNYPYLKAALTRLGVYDYFDFFATPDITNLKKSDPKYWQYSIKKHGVDAKECVLFDDALYAVKAAGKEGIRTVGLKDFPWNENEWEDIKKAADTSLDSIADIDIEKLK